MGKYLDLIGNMSISNFNLTYTSQNDTITDAFTVVKQETDGWLGISFITFAWLLIYTYISNVENRFNLSYIQSIISTNTFIFCLSLIFVYVGLISNIQVFIWCMLLIFFGQIWGIMRTTS